MVRISISYSSEQRVTALIEGRILNDCIEQLKDTCEELLADRRRLRLDLSGVSFISQRAARVLRHFSGRKVALINCSAFVAEQLKVKKGEKQA
jgi:hypothetical protein